MSPTGRRPVAAALRLRSGLARRTTLGALYDPTRNGYGLIRLVLALSIILWHSFALSGDDGNPATTIALLDARVNIFFSLSGFLVLASWERRPHVGRFLLARAARILPAFWVCLVVTAFGIAPLALVLAGQDPADLFRGSHDAFTYVLANATTHIAFFDIAGTPQGVPLPGAWNGAVWMLQWEPLCYLLLAALGVLGLLRRRAVVPVLVIVTGMAFAALATLAIPELWLVTTTLRFTFSFLLGAFLYAARARVPVGAVPAALAVGLVVLGFTVPALRLIALPALCYLVHVLAATMRSARFRLRRDLAYGVFLYGFPIQQLLVHAGIGLGAPLVLAVAAMAVTLPIALVSNVLVEDPARALVRRRRSGARLADATPPPEAGPTLLPVGRPDPVRSAE